MKYPRIALGLLLVMGFATLGSGVSLGVAGQTDLGVLERGETRTFTVYTSTDQNEQFYVEPRVRDALSSSVYSGNLVPTPSQYSEEPIGDWINFQQDRYFVNGSNTRSLDTESGPVTVSRAIDFTISVPQDAEPGYHAAGIEFRPVVGDGPGSGAVVVGQGIYQFSFRVPGTPVRSIQTSNLRGLRTGESKARIDTVIRNTGSVTVKTTGGTVRIQGQDGQILRRFSVGGMTLSPGESELLTLNWNGDINAGTYRVEGQIEHYTGSSPISGRISIPESVQIVPTNDQFAQAAEEEGSDGVPLWLVLLAVVLTGVLLWAFDVDLLWIILFVGGTGITAFVLMTGVPNVTLIVLLLITTATYYLV